MEDDHHGIVSSLMAAKAFLDLGLTPERTVALALVWRHMYNPTNGIFTWFAEMQHVVVRAVVRFSVGIAVAHGINGVLRLIRAEPYQGDDGALEVGVAVDADGFGTELPAVHDASD